MIKAGIIDPTKVVRLALKNAASVASLMITTECLVADKPEKKAPYPPMPPGAVEWVEWAEWVICIKIDHLILVFKKAREDSLAFFLNFFLIGLSMVCRKEHRAWATG